MKNEKNIRFRQSVSDFPLTVSLGEKSPAFGISRWGRSGLHFRPPDDEGFTLRGDRRRVVYKGRRRSHRFTILGDSSFEYDCILEREPESNVIVLFLEGAENYDFFRQPDFVPEQFLKGSYAVYKKETLVGEGTGKLCHIHRPEIIDARGRRCWGELSIDRNELRITIPEKWLGEAAYPVIVDPTIGTTTVGSQYLWDADPPEPWVSLMFEAEIPLNRFLVSEAINGNCNAYFYTNEDEYDAGGRPVIYSDSSTRPQLRRSIQESYIDFRVTSLNPKGWRSGTFTTNGSISSGSYIWFGCLTDYFWFPRFDYGGVFFSTYQRSQGIVPETYPASVSYWPGNFKLSMYFDYSNGQNYSRTLTQGVSLSENCKSTAGFKRLAFQTVNGSDNTGSAFLLFRKLQETVTALDLVGKLRTFYRIIKSELLVISEAGRSRGYIRAVSDLVKVPEVVTRGLVFIVKVFSGVYARDYIFGRFLKAKTELELKSFIKREIVLDSKIY